MHFEDRAGHLVLRFQLGLSLFGVDHHCAKLVDLEDALVVAHPLLLEENRPRRGELDQQRRHQEDGGKQDEQQRRNDHVDGSFGPHVVQVLIRAGVEGENQGPVQVGGGGFGQVQVEQV